MEPFPSFDGQLTRCLEDGHPLSDTPATPGRGELTGSACAHQISHEECESTDAKWADGKVPRIEGERTKMPLEAGR